jgi:serine/threonine-protein kinase
MASAVPAVSPNELVLGRYRPLRPLGTGGSGSVWLARDEASGLEVALKAVPREGKAESRAEREAAVAARLRHPCCLRAYDFGTDDRHAYIAYEYAPGCTLREAIRGGRVSDATAVEIAAQILEGLAHAHARGVVHRDVKPSNVLLVDGDEVSVRLLDFGLARLEEAETLTAVGDVPGTLAYIAPERLAGKPTGSAADVWAAGIVLWEALAGVHPFWTSSVLGTARAIEAGAPSLATARPDLPRALVAAVDRSLSAEPARRPPAAKLAAMLRSAFAERGRKRKRPGGGPAKRAPRPETLVGVALAVLVAGFGASVLPFYPEGWWVGIGALAGVAAFVRPRAGLAVALGAPVLPLGNHSLGLALLYAAVATVWLLLAWREPRFGLLFAVGPLLAPLGALGLMPLAASPVRSTLRRAALAAVGVLVAVIVAGLHHTPFPLTGEPAPTSLGLAGADEPLAVAKSLWDALSAHPGLLVAAVTLGAAAALLPYARERGPWWIAGLGAGLLAATLLAAPAVAALPVVAATWVMCAVLALGAPGDAFRDT